MVFLFRRTLILTLISFSSLASLPEFYGPSAKNASLGNQSSTSVHDPGNLYYNPSLAAYGNRVVLNTNFFYINTHFEPIDHITISNQVIEHQGQNAFPIGSVSTDYPSSYHFSLHVLFPLLRENAGTLGLSYYSPMGDVLEQDSGNPHWPEYVLYRSRYRRSQFQFYYAYPWSRNLAFSLGFHLGLQATSEVTPKLALKSTTLGSYASMRTKVSPSLGFILSATWRNHFGLSYFTFQEEMESHIKTVISEGEVINPSLVLIDMEMKTLSYYDPYIFRLGHAFRLSRVLDIVTTLEYQLWKNYQSPVMRIISKSNVTKSNDFETLEIGNVFYPRIGAIIKIDPQTEIMGGLAYRQSPLQGNFQGSGNSIDSNSLILSGGLTYKMKLFQNELHFTLAAQYHQLDPKKVHKLARQENDIIGSRIGAPGYDVGGNVFNIQNSFQIHF